MAVEKKKTRKSQSRSSTAKKQDSGIPVSYLIGMFFVGFIMILSLYMNSEGIVLRYLRAALQTIFGMGAFILPVSIFGFMFLYYFDKEHYKRNMTAAAFIFMAILVLLDLNLVSDIDRKLDFLEKVKYASSMGRAGFGGGVIGGVFSYFLLKLLGVKASIAVTLMVILVGVIVVTNRGFLDLFESLALALKRLPPLISSAFSFIGERISSAADSAKERRLKEEKRAEAEKKKALKAESKAEIEKASTGRRKPAAFDVTRHDEKDRSRLRDERDDEVEFGSGSFDYEYEVDDMDNTGIIDFDYEQFQNSDHDSGPKEFEISLAPEDVYADIPKASEEADQGAADEKRDISESAPNRMEEYLKKKSAPYEIPPISILSDEIDLNSDDNEYVVKNAEKLVDTLANFGIESRVNSVNIGPSITKYEIQIAPGVKVSRILNLSNDLALSLAASDVRIEAPIPGKSAIGIEIPNKHRTAVRIRQMIESDEFKNFKGNIPMALGKDVEGRPVIADIEKMPHMLIAGATGAGKSVCINTIITSIIYKSSPDDVKLILIDPKVVELSIYNGIPHLYIPVVTNPNKAAGALNWAVTEMGRRYEMFANAGVRDISGYNKKETENKLPKIVMIIDELSDLMMTASSSEVEELICRIAQMARAAGIHLIIATQRPSVDVITGTIKANIPSRISFAVSSQTDSRTILDMGGAEKLLGRGDMLFFPQGMSKPQRIQGAFIDDGEVERLVSYLKSRSEAVYEEDIMQDIEKKLEYSQDDCDEMLPEAIDIVINEQQASTSFLQRRLKVGYARAARIIDQMEERGIVGPPEGNRGRKVLLTREDIEEA